MKSFLVCCACSLTISSALSAQAVYDELPAGFIGTTDKVYDQYLLPRSTNQPVHIQYCYDLAEIANSGSPAILELAWRRNNFYTNAVPAGSVTMTVEMGHSTNLPSAMSTKFANNIAIGKVQVFQGTMNYPAAVKGNGPAPWTHVLKIVKPVVFNVQKGTNKSLTIDMIITATTGYTSGTYPMDAAGVNVGERRSNGSGPVNCPFSNTWYANSIGYTTDGLINTGGNWSINYNNILPGAPGLMALSGFGLDHKGSWALPIDLKPLTGVGGCTWHVGLESGVLLAVVANGFGTASTPTIRIPPGLGGRSFYDHSLWLDKAANPGGLVVGLSSKWYIGTGKSPSANTLYKLWDTKGSEGKLRTGQGTMLRLTR